MDSKAIIDKVRQERESVAYFMRRLYNKNLTTCSGGNLSLRCRDGIVLATPSALDKGELTADQVLVLQNGKNLTPHLTPTIEVNLHLAVLAKRPEMNAVVHAHPVFATAFACADMDIDMTISSEVYAIVGKVTQAAFAAPGSDDLAQAVAEAMAKSDAALMRNHGAITTGPTLLKAFDLLEVLEVSAKMNFIVKSLGCGRPLTGGQLNVMNTMLGRTDWL